MEEYKLFIQRIGLLGFANILVSLGAIILLPILTKTLSIQEYGIWVQINVTVGLIMNIAPLALPYAMVRFLSPITNKEKIKEGFYSIAFIVLVVSLVFTFLIILFSKNLAVLLFGGNVTITILTAFIGLFSCLNALLINYFRTFQQMRKYSIFILAQAYLSIFIVSYFLFSGYQLLGAVIGLLISQIIILSVTFVLILFSLGFKIPHFKNINEYLSFSLPTIPGTISYWAIDSSDRYIIGILLGSSFVGYYSPGYSLGNLILLLIAPFATLLPAVISKYYDQNHFEEVAKYLEYSLKYFLLLAIPSVFGLSLLSKPLLLILTTPEIASNGYLVTSFVALSALLFGIYGIIGQIIVLEKKTQITGMIWIIASIVNVVFNIMFIPLFGLIGAAAITLISYLLAFILTLFYSQKYFKFNYNFKFMIKSIFSSIIMSTFLIALNPHGLINIIIVVIICVFVYFVFILLLGGIKKEEFSLFKDVIL